MPAREGRHPAGHEAGRFPARAGQGAAAPLRRPAGKPIPGVYVLIDKWRGGESLYNHRHPNVLDTQIPNQADERASTIWTWAPDDAVTYRSGRKGCAEQEAALTANGTRADDHAPEILRITGKVTDAATGRPIDGVTAIPVLELLPGRLFTERQRCEGTSRAAPTRSRATGPTSPTACGSRPRATARP